MAEAAPADTYLEDTRPVARPTNYWYVFLAMASIGIVAWTATLIDY